MTVQCATCRFAARETGFEAFTCRRRAPITVHDPRKHFGVYPEAFPPRWPWVKSDDWCGDHEPAEPATGAKQVMQWARAYVDNETAIGDCHPDRLTTEERAGLAELERLEKLL